jgi:Tfp pilus assembly protein PilO
LNEDLEKAEQQYRSSLDTDRRLAENIPLYAKLRQERDEINRMISRNQKALPTEAEVPAFFETLERKVKESGVEINKWSKKPEETVETFIKVPVEIEIVGTYTQIKRFFWSLLPRELEDGKEPERERVVSIEGLALTNPTLRDREIVLNAKFTAVTFRQDTAAATQPGAPAAPNPNLRPPSEITPGGSGAAPLPSAATPAGAKARTEDAIDKSVDRAAGSAAPGSASLKDGIK